MLFYELPSDLAIILLSATLVTALIAMLFAVLAYVAARRVPPPAVTREETQALLRQEGDAIRNAADLGSRGLRQELGQTLATHHSDLVDRVVKSSDAMRDTIEARMDAALAQQSFAAHGLREELSGSFQRMRQGVAETLTQASEHQKERLDQTQRELKALAEINKNGSEQFRQSVEQRLDLLRTENATKLEEMRRTVDEQLQNTLEKRLGESFNRVVEQLNKAYEVFGEMKTISSNVGDLKNVLTNPKLRGTFGEVQLSMLLQDFLAPSQYIKDAQVREHTGERVEYAIRLPLSDGEEMLLPVDAKFPREDHEHMIAAHEAGDLALADHFRKQLENRVKSFARDIGRKYLNPPVTTEHAILFLPTESLFAEVLRQPGLFEHVQRECKVLLAGPTTFAAILHAFQINHRSMAIAKRSSEVWKILSGVRTEFGKYNEAVGLVAKQLGTVTGSVDKLHVRTRQMDKVLKQIDTLPDDGGASKLLGLDRTMNRDVAQPNLRDDTLDLDEFEGAPSLQ